jgi:hypothetical protein
MRITLLSLLLLFTTTPETGGRKGVVLNREFKLKVGQAVVIKAAGLRVTFKGVPEDSRCPEGVNCIWAGNARVAVGLSGAGSGPATVELNTGVEPRRQPHLDYEVELLSLSPHPKQDKAVDAKSYVATLVVRKRK